MIASDSALSERAFQHCEAAFGLLVDRYQTALFNFCYRLLGCQAEAEDAAQQTFLRAYEHRQSYDPRRPVKTWLMAIAAHDCIDRLRRRRLTWLSLEDDCLAQHPALQHPDPGPEAAVLKRELCCELAGLLARLAPADARMVVMHYWGCMTYAEIATATGTTLPAVKSRLHRARGRLSELVRQASAGPAPKRRVVKSTRPANLLAHR